jgi:adenine-specific DNA-methyltransferase
VRYIGNKTRLLSFIGDVLTENHLGGGTAIDAFAGTAAVGRFLKSRGFAVTSCDLMTYSFVFQKAYVELDVLPSFDRILGADSDLRRTAKMPAFEHYLGDRFGPQEDLFGEIRAELRPIQTVLAYLERFLPPVSAFITRNYAPSDCADGDGRMFFSTDNAQRIDAIRLKLNEWQLVGLLTDHEFYLLLAALLEGSDAVANTTGVYAAFVKSWQPNARRRLRLDVPEIARDTGLSCRAVQGDVNDVIHLFGPVDLLYLDPPYNTRQYSAYYHVPEIIAKGWFDTVPELRGKTGLIDDTDKKSQWSTRNGCVEALQKLVSSVESRFILMSYNSEGIIPENDVRRIFSERGIPSSFHIYQREYQRYRSDADHDDRTYKADLVQEKIYFVRAKA